MLKQLTVLIALICGVTASAQKPLVWQLLGMTTYQTTPSKDGSMDYIPQFPSILETKYENEEVAISGYLIPIDLEAGKYALSKNPFTSCFFCGNAGPETVIELRFDKSPGRFATDEYVMIKGIFKLNRDGSGLFFVIRNAEIHG